MCKQHGKELWDHGKVGSFSLGSEGNMAKNSWWSSSHPSPQSQPFSDLWCPLSMIIKDTVKWLQNTTDTALNMCKLAFYLGTKICKQLWKKKLQLPPEHKEKRILNIVF